MRGLRHLAGAAAALAGALALGGAAWAQDPTRDGEFRAPLERLVGGLIDGRCDPELMVAEMAAACEQQWWQLGDMIQQFGAITEMRLIEVEGEEADRLETYEAEFSSGRTLTLEIGRRVDGKFNHFSIDG